MSPLTNEFKIAHQIGKETEEEWRTLSLKGPTYFEKIQNPSAFTSCHWHAQKRCDH